MQKWLLALTFLTVVAAGNPGCATNNPKPNVDPEADAALRLMGATLAKARSFSLRSTATNDERLANGQLVQVPRSARLLFSRPAGFQADVTHGPDSYRIWHQGKELTILDAKRNLYSVVRTPERVDAMLDFLADKYGLIVPLDDLLYPDPYRVLIERVNTGAFVGQQEINGHTCDHLLFTQDNVDWQIWIGAEEPAVPWKVVITRKDDPDHAQYEGVLDEWQLNNAPADPEAFVPQVPQSATQVEITELLDAAEGGPE